MALLGTTTLGHNQKITLIKKVIEKLNVEQGDILAYYEENGEIIIRKG